jgi:serralysin
MYGETQLFDGIFSDWETVGVETVGGANLVMWKNLSGNYLHQWMMDANWTLVSAQGAWGLATVEAMAQESLFGQDFNGDGVIGQVVQPVETAGSVQMVKDGNQRFYAQVGSGTPVALMYGETQLFDGIFGDWETVGVETVGGANLVMWKNLSGNYLHQWMMDANWTLVSAQGAWGLATVEAMAQESLFGQDFNGDGVIGQVVQPVETAGSVKMVKDANQKFYAQTESGSPVALMYGGTQLFDGIFGGWETVGVETVAGENLVMWKNVSGNYLHQWLMDANWTLASAQGAWGLNSFEGMAKESVFGQDFNGDGTIG